MRRALAALVLLAIGVGLGAMIGHGATERPVLIVDLNGSVAGQEVQR